MADTKNNSNNSNSNNSTNKTDYSNNFNVFTKPMGEVEIYIAHIGLDDYNTIMKNRAAFNMILRHTGGMPCDNDDTKFCATIAFQSDLFREDFAMQMLDKLGVTVAINFNRIYIDKRFLPRQTSIDKYDFNELMRQAKAEKELQKFMTDGAPTPEEDYVYPENGKLPS